MSPRDRRSERRRPASKAASRTPLILLVDDFQDNREMYAMYLEYAGFQVAQASNGHEALDQAFALAPDLIVMDLSLPGVDGWEATRRLKADRRTSRIPVLALTSHALEGFEQGAKEAGCDGFVTKPCLPEDLAKNIRAMLERNSTARPRR